MNTKFVPLISSGVAGPLGLLHLPRIWQKALLGAVGKLADGYKDIGPGYDHMVLGAIGVDADKAREFIRQNKPTYARFEEWIKSCPGVKLDKATIYRSNAALLGYIHDDSTRKEILSGAGIPDNGCVNPDAIDLNNLEDWTEFHRSVVA
jgi:hypothetical protein